MENDAIRASGSNTLVDIWIDGKIRAISVSRQVIEAFLGPEAAAKLTEDDRCEFVRKHLPLVVSAAKAKLADDPTAGSISIDGKHFHRSDAARSGERRKTERRKTERRKEDRPVIVDRRRGDRRKGERRKSPKRTDS